MRIPRLLYSVTLLAVLGAGFACADAPSAPASAQNDPRALSNLSDHELLVAVLTKLNALETRLEEETRFARARFDSLAAVGGIQLAPTPKAEVVLEASLCGNFAFQADGKLESSLSLWGGGEGMLGVDAYGNGAKGLVRGFATQDVKVVPAGGASLTLQLCAKGTGGLAFAGSPMASGAAGPIARAVTVPGAAEALLRNVLQSIPADNLAAAATRLGMDGSRLGQAVDAVASFSLADLQFGSGGAANLLNALPIPADITNMLRNPETILQRAAQASQFAIDRVCGQTLFTGEFAQRASQACDLRGQVPSGQALIGILQGLDGLPTTLGGLREDLLDACGAVNAMRPARVTIPSKTVTFPAGIGDVEVFPGFDRALFPGLSAVC